MAVSQHSHMVVLHFIISSGFFPESGIWFSSARSMQFFVLISCLVEFVVAAVNEV